MHAEDRRTIVALGQGLGPDVLARVGALYEAEQRAFAGAQPVTAGDIAYGDHERHRLDLYAPEGAGAAPILLWVHGGGFIRGDKRAGDLYNAHVGRLAARAGFLGAVINYRLAPNHGWPGGGEDVGLALDWLRANAAAHGGDPARIVIGGTSAGAVHVATYLKLRAGDERVRGAVLLSGLYGFTPLDERDHLYFGADRTRDAEQRTADALAATQVPLFVSCAEFDPPRFQAETLGLLQRLLAANGRMPRAMIAGGHNHYSTAMHLGGRDRRLTDEILAFAHECVGEPTGEKP